MLKVIGKIIGSNITQDGIIPGVKVVKADGTAENAYVGELLHEGDKIVSENPDVVVKVKYLALPQESEYAGVFTVLTDNSVVAPAEITDTVMDGSVKDVADKETAAGDDGIEASSSPYISMDPDLEAVSVVGIDRTAVEDSTSSYRAAAGAPEAKTIVDNTAPTFVSEATVIYDENSTDPVIRVEATDTISDVTYELAPGLDSDLFTIDSATGELSFKSSPDYENPQDIGTDNIYNVDVIARDAYGNEAVQSLAVYINNLNDNTPTTQDIAAETLEDALVYTGALTGQDADGNKLEFVVTSEPAVGSLAVNSETGEFEYDYGHEFDYLAVGETATVTFTYKAIESDSPEAYESTPDSTVTITIVGENDRPVVESVTLPNGDFEPSVSYGETSLEYTESGIVGSGTVRLLKEGDESGGPERGYEGSSITSIDQWSFTHAGGALSIDILTEQTDGDDPFSNDINGDGKIEMIDSQIRLFVKNPDGTFTLYAENDDGDVLGADGSQSDLDSYLSFDDLPAGDYMLAIGELAFSNSEAISGLNLDTDIYRETEDGRSFVEGYGPYQVTIDGAISNVEATTVAYTQDEIVNTFIGLDTFDETNKETPPLGVDGLEDTNQIYGEVFTATSSLLHQASFEIKAASDELELGESEPSEYSEESREPSEYSEEGREPSEYSEEGAEEGEASLIRFTLQKVIMDSEEASEGEGESLEGGPLYHIIDTVYTSDIINLTEMDTPIVTLDNLNITLEEGQKYFFSVESLSGAYQWEYAEEQPIDDLGIGMILADDAPSLEGSEEGTSSNNVMVWDQADFSIRLEYANGETVIFETDGIQIIHEGQLSVSDVDISDTHTFQLLDDTINVTTDSAAEVTHLNVTVNPDGTYSVSGNFDALADGEKATVIFDYTATDNSGAANAVSEPATVSIEVTGTNDRPIVENIVVNGTVESRVKVVDFENIPTDTPTYDEGSMTTTRIYNYENITWNDVTLAHIDSGTDVAGFDNGITSGENMAFNSHGRSPTTLTFNETATFHSVNLTAAYDSEMLLQFVAYKDGVEVYRSDDISINADTPTHVELNWANIDTLVIENITGSIWVMDDFTYSVAGSDERLILETDGLETVYSGVLSVSDLDTTDTHTFQLLDESVSVVTDSAAEVKDLSVVVNADGTYSVSGDFDELAAGEQATVTFAYTATDDSGTDNAVSEPKTVTLTVTGTNDQPVVEDIDINNIEREIITVPAGDEATLVEGRHTTVNGEVFLGGEYIELGIHKSGSFGTVGTKPADFYGTSADHRIGMSADADGFGEGEDLAIDYFLPGSPEEAWNVGYKIDGNVITATNAGLNGEVDVSNFTNVDTSEGSILSSHGTGSLNGTLQTDIDVSFGAADDFYLTTVTLTNLSDVAIDDVRYMRSFDPDNTKYLGGDYKTINTIEKTFEAGDGSALVSAVSLPGDPYYELAGAPAKIFFYSEEANAKVTTTGFALRDVYDPNVYDNTLEKGTSVTADIAISIAFDVGTLDPGESVTLTYYTGLTNRVIEDVVNDIKISGLDLYEGYDPVAIGELPDSPVGDVNLLTGKLSVSDLDVSDEGRHIFNVVKDDAGNNIIHIEETPVDADGNSIILPDNVTVDIVENDDGSWNYVINGDFSALAADESATVSFQYYADDTRGFDGSDGINESSLSDPKTIRFVIKGTNDQPVVEDIIIEPIAEGNGNEIIYEGTFTVSDADVNDTHIFKISTPITSAVDNPDVVLKDVTVKITDPETGEYLVSGNFDALAEGESATLTFGYIAQDSSHSPIGEPSVSEEKFVTLTITGTNDTPVVVAAEDSASLVEDDINVMNEDIAAYSATLNEAYTSDTWTIEHDGGKLQILMSSDEFDTFLKIYDADGNLIATNDDGGAGYNSALLLDNLEAGTYTVEAAGALDEFGTYEIDFLNGITSVTAPSGAVAVESEFGELSADGHITFEDVDVTDTHTISVDDTTSNYGTLTATETEPGVVTWEYTVVNDLVEYLAEGETREEVFEVSIDDGNGGVATQEVTVTITGTNDAPTINAVHSEVTGTVTEDIYNAEFASDTTDAPNQEDAWIFNHTGGDLTVSMNSESFDTYLLIYDAAGNLIGQNDDGGTSTADTNAQLVLSDLPAGTYTIVASGYMDEEASEEAGETVYQSGPYEIIFEPAVNLTSYPEAAVMTEDMTNLFTTGDVVFEDIDLSDTHTVSAASADDSNLGTLSAVIAEDASLGTGVVEWTYSVADSDVQYLAEGETKTETFTITVTDNNGESVEQDITVTIIGTNDRPIVENVVENVSETDFVGSIDVVIDESTGQTITVNNITYASSVAASSNLSDVDTIDTHAFGIATYSSQLGLTSDVALGVTFTEKNPGILELYAEAAADSDKFNSLKSEIIAILQNSTLLSAIVASSSTATELVEDIANATSLEQVESIINETPGFAIEANYVESSDGTSVTLESVSISAEATQAQYDILAEHNVVNIVVDESGAYTISTPLIDPLAGDEDVAITFAYNATDNSLTDTATSESATVTVNVSGDNDAPVVGVIDSDYGVIGMFDIDGGNVDLSSVVESSGLEKINSIVVGGRTELNVSAEDVLEVVGNDDHILIIESSDDMADAVHLDDSFDKENAYDNGDGTHTYQAEVEGTSEVVNVIIEDTIYVD